MCHCHLVLVVLALPKASTPNKDWTKSLGEILKNWVVVSGLVRYNGYRSSKSQPFPILMWHGAKQNKYCWDVVTKPKKDVASMHMTTIDRMNLIISYNHGLWKIPNAIVLATHTNKQTKNNNNNNDNSTTKIPPVETTTAININLCSTRA